MKSDLKPRILETARSLFNEYGYDGVSMRDIAGRLDISVGNLTYHYRRKEELVEAIVTEQHKLYRKLPVPQSIAELDDFFVRMLAHQQRNVYYFYSYRQLGRISEKIDTIQHSVVEDAYSSLYGCFAILREQGLMKPDSIAGQGEMIIDTIMSLCILGMVKGGNRRQCIWSAIYPLLTTEGQQALKSLKMKLV